MFYSVCVLHAFSAFFYYFFCTINWFAMDSFRLTVWWILKDTLLTSWSNTPYFLPEPGLQSKKSSLLEKVANLWSIIAENPVFNPHQDCSCNHIPVHFLFISLSMVTLHFITPLKDQNHFQPLWDLSLSSVPLLHKDHKDASSEKQSTYN